MSPDDIAAAAEAFPAPDFAIETHPSYLRVRREDGEAFIVARDLGRWRAQSEEGDWWAVENGAPELARSVGRLLADEYDA